MQRQRSREVFFDEKNTVNIGAITRRSVAYRSAFMSSYTTNCLIVNSWFTIKMIIPVQNYRFNYKLYYDPL